MSSPLFAMPSNDHPAGVGVPADVPRERACFDSSPRLAPFDSPSRLAPFDSRTALAQGRQGRQGRQRSSATQVPRWWRGRHAVLTVGLAVAAALVAINGFAQTPAKPTKNELLAELARLQRDTQILERTNELARGKEFYLVLDPAGPDLALMLRGAELQRYPILGLRVGQARVAWVRQLASDEWQGVIWSAGELDPPRQVDRVVVTGGEPVPAGEEPAPPPIPRTAEEIYPVPAQYHIRFTGGLSIEIRPHEADGTLGRWATLRAWWQTRWRDVRAALWSRDRDTVRLRVVLNPKDAESLYRALPPATRLIVLPGSGKGDPGSRPRP